MTGVARFTTSTMSSLLIPEKPGSSLTSSFR
jgi:hypothetical protein